MALQDFPVLPETYPLFEWANWPDSHAALIPGGPTKQFEKACWNALVDTVADAVEAAGLQWWDGEHFPEDIKMLSEGNVRLQAAHFNHLRSAIDSILELPWRWDYDETSRGYIGRLNFYGSSGKIQDVVYPEYLLELASHINRVLGIMRGTAQTDVQTVRHSSEIITRIIPEQSPAATAFPRKVPARTNTTSDSSLVLLGDLIDFPDHRSWTSTAGPQWQNGVVIYRNFRERTFFDLRGTVRPSDPINVPVHLKTKKQVEASFIRPTDISAKKKSATKNRAALNYLVLMAVARAIMEHRTAITVPLRSVPPQDMIVSGKAGIRSAVNIELNPPAFEKMELLSALTIHNPVMELMGNRNLLDFVPIGFSLQSLHEVMAHQSRAVRTNANAVVETRSDLDVILKRPMRMDTDTASITKAKPGLERYRATVLQKRQKSGIQSKLTMPEYRSAPVFTEDDSRIKAVCSLDAYVWEYPEWHDGGLLIRQAYETVQNESGELEIR